MIVRVVVVVVVTLVTVVVVMVMTGDQRATGVDLEIDRGDAVLDHRGDAEARAPCPDRIEGVADHVDGDAELDQGAEHHVAGGAARAVDVEVLAPRIGGSHRRAARRATRTAAIAAPTPLSMLTTVMPGAHAASMDASATRPSTDTP